MLCFALEKTSVLLALAARSSLESDAKSCACHLEGSDSGRRGKIETTAARLGATLVSKVWLQFHSFSVEVNRGRTGVVRDVVGRQVREERSGDRSVRAV